MIPNNNQTLDSQRKDDHVNLALEQQAAMKHSAFDDVRFVHHSFSDLSMQQVDLSTEWAGHSFNLPFYINGMTGGSAYTKQFNQKLAEVARETGLAMASGSVSAALKDPSVSDSFTIIREVNPNGFVMANLGAHHNLENAKRAVDLLKADALQIHLNVPQEVVMPEGDRDYRSWPDNIADIVSDLGVPVIVKEVGFGMSRETMEQLVRLGVQTIDVSGRGGTNFVKIENDRRDRLDFSDLNGWGQTTPESLLESLSVQRTLDVLASGGIRHYTDIIKALAFGAKATGLSGKFLASVHEKGVADTVQTVRDWESAIRHMMLMLGCSNLAELRRTNIVISGELRSWAEARQIDFTKLATRVRYSTLF